MLHLGIIAKAFAIISATLTDDGARPANFGMQDGAAQHKVGARLADFGTVKQEPNMGRLDVHPAHVETVGDNLQTNVVTLLAQLDTLLHFWALLM